MQNKIVKGIETSIRTDNGYTIVNYRGTDVVKFNNKEITLDNGGFITATTCLRMNQAASQFSLNYHVFREKKKMFVSIGIPSWDYIHGLPTVEFTNNRVTFKR